MKSNRSLFQHDFDLLKDIFPKLSARWNKERGIWIINGELDICDTIGDYWGTFAIGIFLAASYPFCVPVVIETSKLIPREEDWHISENGECCLDVVHRILAKKKTGISIFDFVKDTVYPYFANQLYRIENGNYAAGEFQHGFEGICQFYSEELNITSPRIGIAILESIKNNKIPSRNDACICGKEKFKRCHLESVEFLKMMPLDQINFDLLGFKKQLDLIQ